MSVYEYTVQDTKGNEVSMEQYRGKVLLVVNTATGCGFTPQYAGLQKLYEDLGPQGFEVLDFPCNQFMHQAPGTNEEIAEFCQLKYHTTFQTFAKVEVNGDKASPLFQYLRSETGGKLGNAVKWNFTKFLVDREGNVVARFAPTEKPEALKEKIEALL